MDPGGVKPNAGENRRYLGISTANSEATSVDSRKEIGILTEGNTRDRRLKTDKYPRPGDGRVS